MIATINPYTGRTERTFAPQPHHRVEAVLQQAQQTFLDWRQTSFAGRARLMKAVGEGLRRRRDHYAALMTLEMGKVRREALAEVDKCADLCDYYADHAEGFLADEPVATGARRSLVICQPLGIVLAVMPWNFPFWQVFRFAVPNLMAGNVGVLKHASNVPQCALAIEEAFREAGFPACALATLLVESAAVEELIAHPLTRAVTLTGSEAAGMAVGAAAGRHLKKSVLELGGSDPFVVLADADLEQASRAAARARMINVGQSCIAAKRFIVERHVVNAFTDHLVSHLKALTAGDPAADATDYGPMARADLADELLDQVRRAVAEGAQVVLGGDRPDRPGAFFNPTVLTDVRPGTTAWREELFGPVATVISAADADDAVRIANDSPFGLGGSVWTRDLEKGERVARALDTGGVFVNEVYKSDQRLPFGGVKRSGYGRELSRAGIRAFVNEKSLWIA